MVSFHKAFLTKMDFHLEVYLHFKSGPQGTNTKSVSGSENGGKSDPIANVNPSI